MRLAHYDAIGAIQFRDLVIKMHPDGTRHYLQVAFLATCSVTGAREWQFGRKWFVSEHMTVSELVQTALMACLACVEHEAREAFTYKGRAIFGPHFDVEQLVQLCDSAPLDVRIAKAEG